MESPGGPAEVLDELLHEDNVVVRADGQADAHLLLRGGAVSNVAGNGAVRSASSSVPNDETLWRCSSRLQVVWLPRHLECPLGQVRLDTVLEDFLDGPSLLRLALDSFVHCARQAYEILSSQQRCRADQNKLVNLFRADCFDPRCSDCRLR